ncbi:SRPBCC domain-containing protein [Agromyces protaetiae]|uniref:SRPBCC domain-containing protein n=1 Tax=Agromyces protaetiae TaxID=2509455 RepID=A0A4P6F9S3_9MICO|nr:SRPBCC domain-containing protein [Agromyces protaetiae]QAY72930.1 SRPBCC domain-containing protein [Agromyces protaetiae]
MAHISSVKDTEALTLTVTAEFDGQTVERLWRLWADREQLQRWWGPPGWPATFTRHDFDVPGTSIYFMQGPEGDRHYGWWRFHEIAMPERLRIEDGFGDAEGNPDPEMPESGEMIVDFEPTDAGARFSIRSVFSSLEQLDALIEMGQEEGMKLALGQVDEILAEDAQVR